MSAKSPGDVPGIVPYRYHIMYSSNLGKKMRGPPTDWERKKKFASKFSHSGAEFLCGGVQWEEFQRTIIVAKVHSRCHVARVGTWKFIFSPTQPQKRKDRSVNSHARDLSSRTDDDCDG